VISNRKFIEQGDPNQNCQISMYSPSLLLGKETQKKLKLLTIEFIKKQKELRELNPKLREDP